MRLLLFFILTLGAHGAKADAVAHCQVYQTDGTSNDNYVKDLLSFDVVKAETFLLRTNGQVDRDFNPAAPKGDQWDGLNGEVVLSFSPLPNLGVRLDQGEIYLSSFDPKTHGYEIMQNSVSGAPRAQTWRKDNAILSMEFTDRKLQVVCGVY